MTADNVAEQSFSSARIYGQSGALKDLLDKIYDPQINTLDDVLQFRKTYASVRQKKIDESIAQVKLQLSKMMSELDRLRRKRDEAVGSKSEELKQMISRLEGEQSDSQRRNNFFANMFYSIKKWTQEQKIKYLKKNFQTILRGIAKDYDDPIASVGNKIRYTENNVRKVAEENIFSELCRLDELNNNIERNKYLIYGAIGETRVINELKKLPKTYHVINDFRDEFSPPIYNRAEDDRIYSIQVDHLVVGPTGIFIVETKYWSSKSMSDEALFSPVKQVKRAGFALFVLLNDAIKSQCITSMVNNWGERKVSPKQIVASVNSVPHAEFQYVKVLGVERLNSYITYGKQEFTNEEIQDIVGYLLQ